MNNFLFRNITVCEFTQFAHPEELIGWQYMSRRLSNWIKYASRSGNSLANYGRFINPRNVAIPIHSRPSSLSLQPTLNNYNWDAVLKYHRPQVVLTRRTTKLCEVRRNYNVKTIANLEKFEASPRSNTKQKQIMQSAVYRLQEASHHVHLQLYFIDVFTSVFKNMYFTSKQ